MQTHNVVSQENWLVARKELLIREKEFTRARDELTRLRRELPWVKLGKRYLFDGPDGKETLSELFAGRSQLIVYHFMFHPDWTAGCKSCSFWADNFNAIIPHLNQRDVTMIAVSRAPLQRLEAFRKRMDWQFKWVSSSGNDFNRDFHVSFTPEQLDSGDAIYNYEPRKTRSEELPGISVFFKSEDGEVFHTYSCYARGLDMLNCAYHYLDLTAKGRDEDGLSYTMEWVRLRDEYASRDRGSAPIARAR